jgi:uncharacterized protein YmfQ (DUF2313 family)
MALTRDDYRQALHALAPPGRALPTATGTSWAQLLDALAGELARLDGRAQDLRAEADPRTTLELLADWERVAGLPDPCAGENATLQERRGALVQRLASRGGQSAAFFRSLAERLGYTVTVAEYRPFLCGVSSVGAQALNPAEIRLAWRLRLKDPRVTSFRAGQSRLGTDPLLKISRAEGLECIVQRLKPAHTNAFVAYEGA